MVVRLTDLTPRIARRSIVKKWWANLPVPLAVSAREADQAWDWEGEVRRIAGDPDFRGYVALTATDDHEVEAQGAMICDLRARSIREPARPALYLRLLAVAPRNRFRLVREAAVFRGVGEGLVRIALMESYQAGFLGRVIVRSLPEATGFYEKQSFTKEIDPISGREYYEIDGETALSILKREGWIG